MHPAFSVVEEQPEFVVINKSPGIGFHDESSEPGICTIVQNTLGYPVFPVHRLDKPTSGLLILPKSAAMAKTMTEEFSQHRVEKYYLALSDQKPSKKQGWVTGDMVKSRGGAWKLTREKKNPAVTYFYSRSLIPGVRCFLLRLYSGKTHQARVALKSLGAPILGDTRYGGGSVWQEGGNVDRLYLHAFAMRFKCLGREWCFLQTPDQGLLFQEFSRSSLMGDWQSPWELTWPASAGG
ncbi:RNA pseudouridine synthase [Hahella sp. CCB-MM4]|nr:RNA pseudouridine synthase [Hahella sp. CCB-MM4]